MRQVKAEVNDSVSSNQKRERVKATNNKLSRRSIKKKKSEEIRLLEISLVHLGDTIRSDPPSSAALLRVRVSAFNTSTW